MMIPLFIFGVLLLVLVWRVLNWVWFEPKRLEKLVRQQGFRGNPYKLVYGDFKEISTMFQEAQSKPLNLSDDILPRTIPHLLRTVEKYGKNSYLWLGPTPSVLIMEPDLIKEVTNKIQAFQKLHANPLAKLLFQGLVAYEGEKWAKHRKLLNPTFHTEKLKVSANSISL